MALHRHVLKNNIKLDYFHLNKTDFFNNNNEMPDPACEPTVEDNWSKV